MRRYFLLSLLLVLAACARPPVEPLTVYPGLEDELLAAMHQQSEQVKSLKSLAKVTVRSKGRKVSFSQALVLEKPDRMRADILSPFGATVFKMTSDGETLTLYSPGSSSYYTGEPSIENLQTLTQLPVRVEQIVDMVLYDVPLIDAESTSVTARGAEGYVLTLLAGDLRQELWFDTARRLVASYWYRGDDLEGHLTYDSFKDEPVFPMEVQLEIPANNGFFRSVLSSPSLNVPIDPNLFQLDLPDHLQAKPFPDPQQAINHGS